MNERSKMESALKRITIPELRKWGFKGSFPHFRRISGHVVDLLTIQFDRYGGGFILEVARGEASGYTTYWGKHIPANKLRAWDLHPDQRKRLKPREGSGTDSWFRYDTGSDFDSVAKSALDILRNYDWDAEQSHPPDGEKPGGAAAASS